MKLYLDVSCLNRLLKWSVRHRQEVQVEIANPVVWLAQHAAVWIPVVRYDNAHGFCHRDTLHADGSQDKTAIYSGDANENFTLAVKDLQDHWQAHRARFLGELES